MPKAQRLVSNVRLWCDVPLQQFSLISTAGYHVAINEWQ